MDATALIDAVQKLRPDSPPSDNLRIALILAIRHGDMPQFASDEDLGAQVQEVVIQLSATADQHAAVAGDLENLAAVSATEYGPDHLWTLVRAIKVQSQIINLYVGPETANC